MNVDINEYMYVNIYYTKYKHSNMYTKTERKSTINDSQFFR